MITESVESVKSRAEQLARLLERDVDAVLHIELIELSSKVGGGALPLLEVPSMGLKIVSDMLSANKLEASLRLHTPPIIGRIDSDAYVVDPRTLSENDIPLIVAAFKDVLDAGPSAQRPATSFSKKITI
jgi:L-seryl-tRNA(Ser) seleniumtransferase